jgi:hypothetical protein
VFIFNNYKSSKVIQFILLLYYVRCYAQDDSTALLHGINQLAIQLTKISNSHLKIGIVTWKLTIDKKTCLYATKWDTPPCVNNRGIDPAWSGRGAALQALVQSCVGHVCHSSINILYLNCNCCSQFGYHHVNAQITVSHFVSIIFCFIMKKHPLHPLLSGIGGCTPHPPLVNLQLAMQFLIKGLWAWTTFIFLSHFHPLKTCYIVKKVSAEQNACHVQLCHYFIWHVMTCLINVVIDNGCLSMCCSLEAANCTM